MSSIKVYKSSPTSPSKGINKHISLGHCPESQWSEEPIRENFPELKSLWQSCLSQAWNLSAWGDGLAQLCVIVGLSVAVGCPGEGLAAELCNPHRAHRHGKGLAGADVWEHSLHTALNLRGLLEEIKTVSCLGFGWKSGGKSWWSLPPKDWGNFPGWVCVCGLFLSANRAEPNSGWYCSNWSLEVSWEFM